MPSPTVIEKTIYNTLRYFALFDLPLTATQLWRCLITDSAHEIHLKDIRETLAHSAWLRSRVGTRWGYYFVAGEQESVVRRLDRHVLSARKWTVLRRVARVLQYVPFVRMIGVAGSLSLSNTKPDSDFDLLIIARHSRLWTARLMLLIITQLMGRRRKYWNTRAPDKVCLNHYLADTALTIASDNRSVYTALLYRQLIPLTGPVVYRDFMAANPWITDVTTVPKMPALPSTYSLTPTLLGGFIKKSLERWLLEPVGEALERWAKRGQQRVITKHTQPGRLGRVVVSDDELAFHPDSKAATINQHFLGLTH